MEIHREPQETNLDHHLTDEQFTELLLGAIPASIQKHLTACSECCVEAERVCAAIGDFAEQSRLWAERRASARPMQAPVRPSISSWLLRPQAWMAAAMTIALVAGIGMMLRRDHAQPVQQAAAALQPTATAPPVVTAKAQPTVNLSAKTLKADNALLSAIDGELRADESTPASMYDLNVASHSARNKTSKRTSN